LPASLGCFRGDSGPFRPFAGALLEARVGAPGQCRPSSVTLEHTHTHTPALVLDREQQLTAAAYRIEIEAPDKQTLVGLHPPLGSRMEDVSRRHQY